MYANKYVGVPVDQTAQVDSKREMSKLHMYLYIYIYIYIERERERESRLADFVDEHF